MCRPESALHLDPWVVRITLGVRLAPPSALGVAGMTAVHALVQRLASGYARWKSSPLRRWAACRQAACRRPALPPPGGAAAAAGTHAREPSTGHGNLHSDSLLRLAEPMLQWGVPLMSCGVVMGMPRMPHCAGRRTRWAAPWMDASGSSL